MAKLILADVASLTNQNTAISTLNSNSALIEAALENTLSLNGASPNALNTVLDVNNNHIINVPNPSTSHHAVNKEYVDAIVAGEYSVIGPGTTDYLLGWNGTSTEWSRFNQSDTGNVSRTYKDKGQDIVFVEDYGAAGNGVTDDTAAIQAALNTGKTIRFRKKNYIITSALTVTVPGTRIIGSGIGATNIYQNTLTADVFNISANNITFSHLSLNYNGTPTGGVALNVSGSVFEGHSFAIDRAVIGINISDILCTLHHFNVYNYSSTGLSIQAAGDVFVSDFIINAINTTNGTGGGLSITNFAEAIVISNGDILNGSYSMIINAASNIAGSRPGYNAFSNVYFDTSVNGSFINNTVDTTFSNCWFSAGRSGVGNPGCTLGDTSNLTFVNTRFNNCGSNGLYVSDGTTHLKLINCEALGNSFTTGSNVSDGIYFEPNTEDFTIIGCTCSNLLFAGTQRYGIYVAAGTSSRYSIMNCTVTSNGTAGIFDGGTGTTYKTIFGNVGHDTNSITKPFSATSLRATADPGGVASTTSLTNVGDLTANSTGTGSIKFKGATSRDSAGFIKIYVGTTAYYVPVFSAITG